MLHIFLNLTGKEMFAKQLLHLNYLKHKLFEKWHNC